MSLSVQFTGADDGDDGPFQLASAGGWKAFGEWEGCISCLPLQHFYSTGKFAGTDELAKLLQLQLDAYPPSDDVAHTVEQFLTLLGIGDEAETATVVQ